MPGNSTITTLSIRFKMADNTSEMSDSENTIKYKRDPLRLQETLQELRNGGKDHQTIHILSWIYQR